MNPRHKSILICTTGAVFGAVGIPVLLNLFFGFHIPGFAFVALGVFGLACGPILAAMGWTAADGLIEGLEQGKAISEAKKK